MLINTAKHFENRYSILFSFVFLSKKSLGFIVIITFLHFKLYHINCSFITEHTKCANLMEPDLKLAVAQRSMSIHVMS